MLYNLAICWLLTTKASFDPNVYKQVANSRNKIAVSPQLQKVLQIAPVGFVSDTFWFTLQSIVDSRSIGYAAYTYARGISNTKWRQCAVAESTNTADLNVTVNE